MNTVHDEDPVGEMNARPTAMSDGRYLIYFEFEELDTRAVDPEEVAPEPDNV